MTAEYGVRVRSDEGVTYVAPMGSLRACQARIESWVSSRAWSEHPVEIVTRETGPWTPWEES